MAEKKRKAEEGGAAEEVTPPFEKAMLWRGGSELLPAYPRSRCRSLNRRGLRTQEPE